VNRAEHVVLALRQANARVAVAESLTGGLISAAITSVPGSSAVFAGSVVTYEVATKSTILGVDPKGLARTGPVDVTVARQMAEGVARLFSTPFAVATTGVAGPQPHGGFPAGVVIIGWFAQGETGAVSGQFQGDRVQVRDQATRAALHTVTQCVLYGQVRDEVLPRSDHFPSAGINGNEYGR